MSLLKILSFCISTIFSGDDLFGCQNPETDRIIINNQDVPAQRLLQVMANSADGIANPVQLGGN
ncbi:MAG: hypothetical protein DRI57_00380 [Deltaproteobacteria bacterium]|nr:MAG: hypothetical protein DRI57_00380 [Deltaproteobacteria bacterium]